jgi:hypothetical protein
MMKTIYFVLDPRFTIPSIKLFLVPDFEIWKVKDWISFNIETINFWTFKSWNFWHKLYCNNKSKKTRLTHNISETFIHIIHCPLISIQSNEYFCLFYSHVPSNEKSVKISRYFQSKVFQKKQIEILRIYLIFQFLKQTKIDILPA